MHYIKHLLINNVVQSHEKNRLKSIYDLTLSCFEFVNETLTNNLSQQSLQNERYSSHRKFI
jgi:hypothetical protein